MALNGVMAFILPYFTEFGSFKRQLGKYCALSLKFVNQLQNFHLAVTV